MARSQITQGRFPVFSFILLAAVAAIILPVGCKKPGPEQEIREFVSRGEDAASEKNIGELKKMISDAYLDSMGRKKQDLEAILVYYFFRNKSIYLYTRVQSIILSSPASAKLTLFLAMAGKRITAPGELAGIRADLYRFEFDLIRKGGDEWLLKAADWREARLEDFLDEDVREDISSGL